MQYPPIVDLHTHSTASDGTYTPAEAAELAKESAAIINFDVQKMTDELIGEFEKNMEVYYDRRNERAAHSGNCKGQLSYV